MSKVSSFLIAVYISVIVLCSGYIVIYMVDQINGFNKSLDSIKTMMYDRDKEVIRR